MTLLGLTCCTAVDVTSTRFLILSNVNLPKARVLILLSLISKIHPCTAMAPRYDRYIVLPLMLDVLISIFQAHTMLIAAKLAQMMNRVLIVNGSAPWAFNRYVRQALTFFSAPQTHL
jgi:hypothetical protein